MEVRAHSNGRSRESRMVHTRDLKTILLLEIVGTLPIAFSDAPGAAWARSQKCFGAEDTKELVTLPTPVTTVG